MDLKSVRIFRLINNEDVIGQARRPEMEISGEGKFATVKSSSPGWEIKQPALFGMMPDNRGQPTLGMADYLPLGEGDQKTLFIEDSKILYHYVPKEGIVKSYAQMFSGLVIPGAGPGLLKG